MWPVWVETPSNQGQEARDWEPVYFGLFYIHQGVGEVIKRWGKDTCLMSHGLGSNPAPQFTTQPSTSHFTSLSLRVPVFMTIVEIKREMLLPLIRNLLNTYRGPQRWAQYTRSTLF